MAILALEPDPSRAATIRHIVCDVVRAELRLVPSKNKLLEELSNGIPDVMLVPALLSSADEAELLAHLSSLRESGHVEILMTPFRFASDDKPRVAHGGWRQWLGQGQSDPQEQEYACDPRGFAEQLSWSLQRAQHVRQERAELYPRQPEQHEIEPEQHEIEDVSASSLPVVMPDAGEVADASTLAPVQTSDRRAHRRFAADELHGLRAARIKFGPSVRLVDCSEGGALIESEVPLMPESEATLELIGDSQKSTVPFRVVRCHVSTVESRLLYWGACAFTRPLELADLLRPKSNDPTTSPEDHVDRFDITVKAIVERNISLADGGAGPRRSASAGQVRELLTLLREVSRSRPADPGEHSIKDVLGIVIAALERGDKQGVAHLLIEERLDAALPWLKARFAAAPALPATADTEALYLSLPTAAGTPSRVLNVELPMGSILEDWQFRLLKATTYLAALLEPAPAGEGKDRRRHARIRGRFEGRQLGAINMRILIHDISETGCFVDSYHEERSGRRLTLEVHLPDDGWITVQAEVVCSRPGGFAVQFIETPDETRTRLARFVAARAGSLVNPRPANDLLGNRAEGSPAPQLSQTMSA
jgi:PilZ domain